MYDNITHNKRTCGECTACCYFLEIHETNSPVNELCSKCDNGCTIYNDRPTACNSFQCLWLSQEQIPDSLRPDKCGILFELPYMCSTYIGYTNSDNWDTDEIRTLIGKINLSGHSVVVKDKSGNKTFSLTEGQTREQMHDDINNSVRAR